MAELVEKITDEVLAKRYVSLMNRANSKKLDFDLTLAQLKRILNRKRCYYTGEPIRVYETSGGNSVPQDNLSIERVDATRGYVYDNIQAVSHKMNLFKGGTIDCGHVSIEQMKKMIAKLEGDT